LLPIKCSGNRQRIDCNTSPSSSHQKILHLSGFFGLRFEAASVTIDRDLESGWPEPLPSQLWGIDFASRRFEVRKTLSLRRGDDDTLRLQAMPAPPFLPAPVPCAKLRIDCCDYAENLHLLSPRRHGI
jgi:hypothetical protein